MRGMRRRNLAVELLEKLLKGELATRRRKNVVQARSFAEMLEQTIRRYQNRAVEAAQVIEELIGLAREMREANARGERLRLSDDELAFYDALGVNDSAVQVLGDETLRDIARELVETVRNNLTIVVRALAAELALKAIAIKTTGTHKRGHDLLKLFDALDQKTQTAIEQKREGVIERVVHGLCGPSSPSTTTTSPLRGSRGDVARLEADVCVWG